MRGELTPTEQRMLELLAQGLHDAEIAVRIGVPVGDLKQRITVMLRRHRLVDRAALLTWYRGEEQSSSGLRAIDGARWWRWRRWCPAAGLGAAFVALATAFLLLPAEDDAPPAAAQPTTSAEPTLGLRRLPAEPPPDLVLGDPVPLGPGYAVTIIAFEYAPDGVVVGPVGFDRVYIEPTGPGTVVREPIWRIPEGATFDANWTVNNEGTRIAAVYVDAEEQRWMEVQLDSGRFSEPIAVGRNESPMLFAGATLIMRAGGGDLEYLNPATPESRQPVTLRPEGTDGTPTGWSPDTGLLWAERRPAAGESGYLVPSRGTVPRLAVGYEGLVPGRFHGFVPADGARDYLSVADYALVAWRANELMSEPQIAGRFTSVVQLATGETIATYQGEFWPVGLGTNGQFMGMYCEEQCVLATMDGAGPQLTPVDGLPLDAPESVVATQPGPLARVRDLDGHCATLMSGAPPRSEVIGCAASGTLLTVLPVSAEDPSVPHIETANGRPYIKVLTLDGDAAWIERDHIDVHIPGPD